MLGDKVCAGLKSTRGETRPEGSALGDNRSKVFRVAFMLEGDMLRLGEASRFV